ncbi:peptidoglycan recognition protein family protein [Metabacillus sp. Hm71]|uniref:peptidoglycan recognition protein family protein n=1 Tax=Metabacillus sp. Hm71 TaxID=3450743 RepID=UPI003F434407
MKNQFINKNPYSRPGKKLKEVRKIICHWTANPGASAYNHYKYFNNLKDRYASAHIFIDKTEALCIIPLNEVAYHANDGSYRGVGELKPNANYLSIGVELCPEKDGSFHPETIKKAAIEVSYLCRKYKLDPNTDIVRHYDVTRKNCPAPWVKNPKEFTEFKNYVKALLEPAKPAKKEESVQILTGGLSPESVELITDYFIDKNWWFQIQGKKDQNPRALSGGLSPEMRAEFEAWLKERNWYYEIV